MVGWFSSKPQSGLFQTDDFCQRTAANLNDTLLPCHSVERFFSFDDCQMFEIQQQQLKIDRRRVDSVFNEVYVVVSVIKCR